MKIVDLVHLDSRSKLVPIGLIYQENLRLPPYKAIL